MKKYTEMIFSLDPSIVKTPFDYVAAYIWL